MIRIAGVVVLGLLVVGCATSKSVKQQIDPLAERLAAVERQQAGVDGKRLAALEQQQSSIEAKLDAQTAELQALRKDLASSYAASAQMQDAVKEAQLAASRAENAAQKSAKAFELSQVKAGKR
jgi:hypothetical protein